MPLHLAGKKPGTNYGMQTSKTLERIPLGEERSPLPQGQDLRWTGTGLLECKSVKTSLKDLLFSLSQIMHIYHLTQATETTTGTEVELPHLHSQLSSVKQEQFQFIFTSTEDKEAHELKEFKWLQA